MLMTAKRIKSLKFQFISNISYYIYDIDKEINQTQSAGNSG